MHDAENDSGSGSGVGPSRPGTRPRFERLSVRLAVGTGLLVLGPLGAGLYALTQHHFERTVEAERRSVELQGRVLEVALRHYMMDRDPRVLSSVLGEIAAQPEVRAAMILNHEGEIRIASDPARVGERIPIEAPACMVCHTQEPSERDRHVVLDEASGRVLRSVLPIENRPECFGCHAPEERLNGILLMDVSLAGFQAAARNDRAAIVAGAGVVAVLLLAGVGFLVRGLILTRLGRLGSTARSIASGDLDQRATVGGDDVISELAQDLNAMAGSVSRLVTELRDQEQQLASVMNSLSDGLVVLDRDSCVVASNRSFCRRLGSHPEALRGRACHDAVGGTLPCCADGRDCPAARCLATGEVQRAVFRTTSEGGEIERVEEVYASPVFDENGEVARTVEVWRDISERVEEEERLAEIEHLVALGTLASGFSHEMNTPLASMLVCAETVLSRLEAPAGTGADPELLSAVREHAGTIRDQVLRCRKITEQFRGFSRGIPPSREPLDLVAAVRAAGALVAQTARDAGVELCVRAEEPVPLVYANSEVVQHVLLNLLVNAIQACEGRGGAVTLELAVTDDVRILVRDTGCGIPPAERARAFEPFRSSKADGTGLGLFLSRSFMRRFGGDVRIADSAPGVGSCLEVVFARVEEPHG